MALQSTEDVQYASQLGHICGSLAGLCPGEGSRAMPCRVKSNNPTWNVYLRTSVTDSHLGSVGLDLVGAISMGSPIYTLINRPLSECAFFSSSIATMSSIVAHPAHQLVRDIDYGIWCISDTHCTSITRLVTYSAILCRNQ